MFKIMIVDDEPPFLEELKRVISEYAKGCEIIGEAYSGRQALEILRKVKPDIIFTDINMPVMNGIELAKFVHENYQDIFIVAISGYASFDYARDAFRASVFDYLLKPIEQDMVINILNKITPIILQKRHKKSGAILKEMLFSDSHKSADKLEYSYNSYSIIVVNSPLLGFDDEKAEIMGIGSKNFEISTLMGSYINESEDFWLFNSKKTGIVILMGLEVYREGKIKDICRGINGFFKGLNLPVSIGLSGNVSDISKIRIKYKELEDTFYRSIVIGKTQIVSIQDGYEDRISEFITLVEQDRFIKIINEKNVNRVKNELISLFNNLEEKNCPYYIVEKILKQIIDIFERLAVIKGIRHKSFLEIRVDEIMKVARTFGELLEAFWNIVTNEFINQSDDIKSLNAPQVFPRIEEYIKLNLTNSISLLDISETFGVSQSYICNLFRNNTGTSFVEYITVLRLEKAKNLLKDSDMPIKNVAAMVGYADQHYFSRVFKNYTGLTPSEYQKSDI